MNTDLIQYFEDSFSGITVLVGDAVCTYTYYGK